MSAIRTVQLKALNIPRLDQPVLQLAKMEGGPWQLELLQNGVSQSEAFLSPARNFVGVTNGEDAVIDAGQDRLTMKRDGEVLLVHVTRDLSRELINAKYKLNDFDDAIQELL